MADQSVFEIPNLQNKKPLQQVKCIADFYGIQYPFRRFYMGYTDFKPWINIRYFTVTLHLTVFFPAFTVITAVPFFFAVILPLESTFTTLEELDL